MVNKSIDEIFDIFGKSSNISLTELAFIAVVQVALK